MKSFQERNQAMTGLVTMAVMTMAGLTAFYADDLPLLGSGTTYTAYFAESAGLTSGTEVRAAGVKVGSVRDVVLDGARVKVTFKVTDTWLGDGTTAEIRIKTLLGSKYLAIDPKGEASQDPAVPIPLGRAATPFDVNQVFDQLSATVTQIDVGKLGESMRVLADAFKDSPAQVRTALTGLSALSRTISSRDDQLVKLLAGTRQLSQTFAARKDQVAKLLNDGNLLLQELRVRRDAIGSLLRGTRELAAQLAGLVTDNSAKLKPALDQLDRITSVLQRNQDSLTKSLALAGPYYRLVGNTMGAGRWADIYLCGLIEPAPGQGCIPRRPPEGPR